MAEPAFIMMTMVSLSDREYEYLRQIVYQHSRINLGTDKTEMVARRVQKRLRALGFEDFEQYCAHLKADPGGEELTQLLDVISTNVTEFFRESEHFDFLAGVALKQWTEGGRRQSNGPFRVWSAACSSGEEPYSTAIVLAEFFSQQSGSWQVDASDISTKILAQAQKGIYRAERVKLPRQEWLARYFQRGVGDYAGYYRVRPELRQRVNFHHVNLFQPNYPVTEGLDVIFCRNVMIYFDRQTQEGLVRRLAKCLRPGGYLMVGHSESLIGIQHGLNCVRPSIYHRAA